MMNVGAAINFFAGQMGSGHTHILVSRIVRNVIALLHYPEATLIPGSHTVHTFSVQINVRSHFFHALNIRLISSNSHNRSSSFLFKIYRRLF